MGFLSVEPSATPEILICKAGLQTYIHPYADEPLYREQLALVERLVRRQYVIALSTIDGEAICSRLS